MHTAQDLIARQMQAGPLWLDLFHRDASCRGRWLALHPREFALLWRLAPMGGWIEGGKLKGVPGDAEVLADIQKLAPFGMANPEPIFLSKPLRPSRARIVGKRHLRARFYTEEGTFIDGIGFSMAPSKEILDEAEVGVAFVARLSTRMNPPRLELHLKDVRPIQDSTPEHIKRINVIDELEELEVDQTSEEDEDEDIHITADAV